MKTPSLKTPALKAPVIDLDEVRKPAMFVVGAADLAVEQVREAGAKAGAKAAAAYGTLATRGERLVTSLRGKSS